MEHRIAISQASGIAAEAILQRLSESGVKPDSVFTPFTLIKIPSPTSIADNFWREGNILADVLAAKNEMLAINP